jgi:hypothetical protein
MRITLDPLAATADGAIPFSGSDGHLGALWSAHLPWTCRGTLLDLRVIATEAIPLPDPEPSEPPESAVARVLQAIAGQGALLALLNPGAAFGPDRVTFTEGVRLFALTTPEDLATWDAALSRGLPVYGLRGLIAADVFTPRPTGVISALAYGLFLCEEHLRLTAFAEDRAGVTWTCDADDAVATVIARGGFEIATIPGKTGQWKDLGNEAYLRVVIRSGTGACWTQPRFISPKRTGPPPVHGGH